MKKKLIALLLCIVLASGSIGSAPVLAAEHKVEEPAADQGEASEEEEVSAQGETSKEEETLVQEETSQEEDVSGQGGSYDNAVPEQEEESKENEDAEENLNTGDSFDGGNILPELIGAGHPLLAYNKDSYARNLQRTRGKKLMKKPKNTLTGASIIASAIAAAECAKQHVNENPETELREQTGAAEQSGDQNTDPAGQSGQVKNESADPDAAGSSEAAESSAASSEAAVSSVESSEAAVSSVESLIDDYSPSANWNVEEYAPPGMYNLSFYPCKILS